MTAFDDAVTRALDQLHKALGRAATYTAPGGAATPCVILVDRADDVAELGQLSVVATCRRVQVRRSEVAMPARGGVFTAGAESFSIVQQPRTEDPDALVWTCLCDPI